MDQQESSTTKLEEQHPTTTSGRRRSQKPTLANAAFIACQTVQSVVMNLRGGRHKSNNGATSKTTSKVKAALPGETELETLLNIAEYEVHQDPYRGLLSHQQSLETGTLITTPWNACEWGSLPPDQTFKEDLCPQMIVRHVGHCACPSLKAWTRQLQTTLTTKKGSAKKSKKRKLSDTTMTTDPIFAVGLRPTDVQYRCSCDYNPLCLGSLGGVVTEIITERYKDMEIPSSESSEAKVSPPPPTESPPKVAREGEEKGMIEAIQSQKGEEKGMIEAIQPQKGEERGMIEDIQSQKGERKGMIEDIQSQKSTSKEESTMSSNKENNKTQIIIDLEAEKKDESSPSAGEKKKEDYSKEQNGGLDAFDFLGADETAQSFSEEKSVVQSKPLEKNKLIELPEGNPADIYTAEDQTQQYLTHIQYTPSTTDELKRLRRTLDMDTSKIRSYVYRTLRIQHHSATGEADGLTLDSFMEALRQWHNSLLFVNPVDEERRLPSDRMTLSLPPGIQNLGATCYLNTQLQCLAQNTAFLNGIFSWRMVNTSHNMNSVMTKLQSLLAQMVLGGDCKLTTLDFSNALGLEHDEQQDPNEFARLLFERMDESFQQCDNDGDLANLLQRIFHGVTTYETICMTCGNSSERSEGFMDLNLPIIKRPKEKATTIKALFAKNVDTDVQYCLDQYTCAELLEGDNQYLCSACDCKRDAKRILKLTELPPVLNVQLSRYVFDRAKFVKKKLTDKVLLPTTLHVEKSGGLKKKYLLCAVMRHQGTSAYSGHYVAEAMDWLTGQWFEFNDETVKVLPEGPSCSYDPDANDSEKQDDKSEEKQKKPSTSSGSQDAYNMYYVDEDFLSKNAADAMLRRSRLCLADKMEGNSVLGDVTSKREAKYAILSG
jgi:ubiquitin C-terminal hydrolase